MLILYSILLAKASCICQRYLIYPPALQPVQTCAIENIFTYPHVNKHTHTHTHTHTRRKLICIQTLMHIPGKVRSDRSQHLPSSIRAPGVRRGSRRQNPQWRCSSPSSEHWVYLQTHRKQRSEEQWHFYLGCLSLLTIGPLCCLVWP